MDCFGVLIKLDVVIDVKCECDGFFGNKIGKYDGGFEFVE